MRWIDATSNHNSVLFWNMSSEVCRGNERRQKAPKPSEEIKPGEANTGGRRRSEKLSVSRNPDLKDRSGAGLFFA